MRVRLLKVAAKSANMLRSSLASRYSVKPAAAIPIAASTTGTTRPSSKSSARAICSKLDADIALRLEASLAKHLPALSSVAAANASALRPAATFRISTENGQIARRSKRARLGCSLSGRCPACVKMLRRMQAAVANELPTSRVGFVTLTLFARLAVASKSAP